MATSRKSSQSQSQSVNNTQNVQEDTMNTQTQTTSAADINDLFVNDQAQEQATQETYDPETQSVIINVNGDSLVFDNSSLITLKSMTNTFFSQYEKKAKEVAYADNRPKPQNSIDYDRSMFNRAIVIKAFVDTVLDGLLIPSSDDRANEIAAQFKAALKK